MFTHIIIAVSFLAVGLLIGANNTNKVKKAAQAAQDAANEQLTELRRKLYK